MRSRLNSVFVAAAWSLLAVVGVGCGMVNHTEGKGFKRFDESVAPLPPGGESRVGAVDEALQKRTMELHFELETRNPGELEERVSRGETISNDEMKEKYSGAKEFLDALVSWLKDQGFEITRTNPDYTSVEAKATVAQIEKALDVRMSEVTYKGTTGPAATTAPGLPRDIGAHVIAINGLQPFIQAAKHKDTRE